MKTTVKTLRCIQAVIAGAIMSVVSITGAFAQAGSDVMPRGISPTFYTGVGPAIAGSTDYSKIPSKAKKFLEKHCDGHAVVRCEKNYISGTFSLSLADGIDMEFDAKGNLTSISAPANYSL